MALMRDITERKRTEASFRRDRPWAHGKVHFGVSWDAEPEPVPRGSYKSRMLCVPLVGDHAMVWHGLRNSLARMIHDGS